MKLRHVTSARQFDIKTLQDLFAFTDKIKSGKYNNKALSGKIMATLFYQPSTRTRFSFESAILKLGGSTISSENAAEFSSAIKGETMQDTIRIVDSYADVIVIRHPQSGITDLAASYSKVPVINAGDGVGEHPTQALLDLYTIFEKKKTKEFTIAICGDHAHYRPHHSLSYLLSLYPKIKIIYVSPKRLSMPKELREHLKKKKIHFVETEDFTSSIKEADVIYQGRIPKEYLGAQYKKYLGKFILDKRALSSIKKNAIIMHPLPRVNEITPDVDSDPRAIYFEEARNGLYVRMALLLSIL
ncbi:MAG: aspartate carbamoyltransferase [Candidatus Curtissbacteria bacterium]|nr:aspartate carbamoyltransferase [Candidatus Curtissbacteria bacterium]